MSRRPTSKDYRQTGVVIDVNTAFRLDAKLQVGAVTEKVSVTGPAVQVETSNTQMGEVIASTKMTALPLSGRSYTDSLALQPGVAPVSTNLEPGFMQVAPSGGLNPGNMSISGQRETAKGFMVNGGNSSYWSELDNYKPSPRGDWFELDNPLRSQQNMASELHF